jgi:pimeloyl-ACP methyl ester carboxylesterase
MKTLLMDGWCGNHRRLERLRRQVAGGPGAEIWPYDSSGRTSLETLGADLAAFLRSGGEPFHALGYSMGGLVLREAMRQAPELPLARAVFLHTPHQGTWAAHLRDLPALREMRPGSAFLRRLAVTPWTRPALNLWCPGDLVVVPGWRARWSAAHQEERCDLPAHAWPLVAPGIHRRIAAFLHQDRHPDFASA